MFGKKDTKKPLLPNIKIEKIPDDFYAGTNPVVKFRAVEKQVDPIPKPVSILTPNEKIKFDKKTVVGSGKPLHPINLLANWKFLLIASAVLIIIGSTVAGGYYYWQYKKTVKVAVVPIPPVVNIPVVTSVPVVPSEVVVPPPVVEPPPIVINSEVKIDFPSTLLAESVDTDKDEISDLAEEIFKTDPTNPDTDGDKYSDGHEVYYLYNPAGVEPMRLLDSKLVAIYSNPAFGYELYYPVDWAVGNVDSSYKDVLFSTLNGENIEVRVIDKNVNQTFNDWFAINAPNERLSDYTPFESVFKETGLMRSDNLVYLFPKDDKVIAIIYHTTDAKIVNYKIIGTMMARSFQFGQASAIPDRIVEVNQINPTIVSSSTSTITSTIQ